MNDRAAAFCRSCGQPLSPSLRRTEAPDQARAAAESVRCGKCRAMNAADAEFCRHCGGSLRTSSETPPGTAAPPREAGGRIKIPSLDSLPSLPSLQFNSAAAQAAVPGLGHANGVIGVGAAAVLIGCVLPLAGSMGYDARLVPDIVSRVPEAVLVPMSAFFLLICAGALYASVGRGAAVVAGLCVAVASPGFVAALVAARMGSEVLSRLGPANGLIDVGAGGIFLLLGYALALIGALAVLAQIPAEVQTEESS